MKAVASFAVPVHLICGGRDKDSPFASILAGIKRRDVRAYLIGEAEERIAAAWSPGIEITCCGTLSRALELANENASEGEVVLLAPGCASFDQYSSYAERGEAFQEWVRAKEEEERNDER